jgi:hypothetical protein
MYADVDEDEEGDSEYQEVYDPQLNQDNPALDTINKQSQKVMTYGVGILRFVP